MHRNFETVVPDYSKQNARIACKIIYLKPVSIIVSSGKEQVL